MSTEKTQDNSARYTFETLPPRALFALGWCLHSERRDPSRLRDILGRLPSGPDDIAAEQVLSLLHELRLITREAESSEPTQERATGEPQDYNIVPSLSVPQKDHVLGRLSAERPARRANLIREVSSRFEIAEDSPLGSALRALDRLHCIPQEAALLADVDTPVAIHEGMTESALLAVIMTVLAVNPQPGERVLICGVKGGYLAAVVAPGGVPDDGVSGHPAMAPDSKT